MPQYEMQCINVDCEEYGVRVMRILSIHTDLDLEICEECALPMEWLPSLTSMHPDNMWAGHVTSAGDYVTSKKSYNRILKEKNLEMTNKYDREVMRRKIPGILAERKQKVDEKIDKFVNEQLQGIEFPNTDGPLNIGMSDVALEMTGEPN